MKFFELFRLVAHVLFLVFSLIVLGLSANLVSNTDKWFYHTPSWLGFTLFVAIFSLLVGVPLLVIDRIRNGAITGMVAVELAWTGILGVFWLAAAGSQAGSAIINELDCSDLGFGGEIESQCHQFKAMEAFSWLNWLLLWGWTLALLVFSIIALTRGNKSVFTSPAGQTDYFARSSQPMVPPVQYQPTGASYPPMQQQFSPQYAQQPMGHPVAAQV
ncbi:hypothetical protein BKA62DRAFT_690272 [Auriculariales sp. MPI-PUGE-AT-0066]|nr:hypothetical protein BKA62DRAFT_690272 [Auriculariales sp. MPI-PUGE-AT-0066]